MKNKADVIKYLETNPVVSVACQSGGISRATYYRWCKEYKEFKEKTNKAKKLGISFVSDLAESQLITLIKEKHPTAIFYWLNNHRQPYSDKKIELSSKEKQELVDTILSYEPLSGYKLLAEKTVQGKIPRFLFNVMSSLISKSSKFQQEDIDNIRKATITEVKSLKNKYV